MKIAIFDMDGTLINSAKDITISVNAVRALNHQLDELDEDFVIEAINKEERNLAKLFYSTEVYEERDRILFEEHYHHQCIQNVYLYEGVKETLLMLNSDGVKISVATNAPTQFARKMLAKCGVLDLFDVVIGADKVKKSKPDKEMLEFILKNYSYEPSHKALMIGDNSKDMLAAKNAGIEGAFATWGFSPKSSHHRTLNKPTEVIEYFQGIQ